MPKKGFIDKNLYGLKDRINSSSMDKNTEGIHSVNDAILQGNNSDLTDVPSTDQRKENVSGKDNAEAAVSAYPDESNSTVKLSENNKEESVLLDKEFAKALVDRKKEFIRTRRDVLKKLHNNLDELFSEIQKHEDYLSEAKTIKRKLDFRIESINALNEKEWDKKDFSFALADAMKKVEGARLELFTLQMKTDCLEEDKTPGLEKHDSIIPELTSLSAWQLFKMGISFFFPLIIGLLLTGIIISLAMLVAMGTI